MAKQVKRAWFTDIVSSDIHLGVAENTPRTVDGVTDQWQALTEALTVRYEAIILDADLVSLSSSYSSIHSKYHQTILNKAIAMGYQDPRHIDLNTAQYFEQLYERDVKKAKKFSKGQMVSTGRIVPQDF